MKVYGDEQVHFGFLTFDDLGMAQGQGQSVKFSLLKLYNYLESSYYTSLINQMKA